MCFLAIAILVIVVSRKSLGRPDTHGFYRMFAFLSATFLVWKAWPNWMDRFDGWNQIVATVLLYLSLYLLFHSLYLLRTQGGNSARRTEQANFSFENTERLVQGSLYRYIRHPMYASLLLLIWGAFLKAPDLAGLVVAGIGSGGLAMAAKVEEGENIQTFGAAYRHYMQRTHMFIPYLL
jgi:protein-S-isoprenylcysteine O-methyltransferase Ste14